MISIWLASLKRPIYESYRPGSPKVHGGPPVQLQLARNTAERTIDHVVIMVLAMYREVQMGLKIGPLD